MIFEDKNRVLCPVTELEVVLTELYDAEGGGSCQADICLISRTCSLDADCRQAGCSSNCLLISDFF